MRVDLNDPVLLAICHLNNYKVIRTPLEVDKGAVGTLAKKTTTDSERICSNP